MDYEATYSIDSPDSDKSVKLKAKDYERIKRDIKAAQKSIKKDYADKWDTSLKLYLGDHYDMAMKQAHWPQIVVNWVLPIIEDQVSVLSPRYVSFELKPWNKEAENNVAIAEVALRYGVKESHLVDEVRRCIKDMKIYGQGFLFIGWLQEFTDGMRMEDGRHPLEEETPDSTPNEDGYQDARSKSEVRTDRPFVKRIAPCNFILPSYYGRNLDDHPWVATCELMPLDEVKGNHHWKNTKQIKGSTDRLKDYYGKGVMSAYEEKGTDYPSDIKMVEVYRYYDKRRRLYIIMCDEHDKPLYESKWHWEHDEFPFAVIQGPGHEDCFHGIALPILIEPQVRELNEVHNLISMFRLVSAPAFQHREGALSPKAKKVFSSGVPLRLVGTQTNTNETAIQPIPVPSLPAEATQNYNYALQNLHNIAGTNEFATATARGYRKTTDEVQALQSVGGPRAAGQMADVEDFLIRSGEQMLAWIQQNGPWVRDLPVYDENMKFTGQFVDIDAEMEAAGFEDMSEYYISGKFLVEISVSETARPDRKAHLDSYGVLVMSATQALDLWMKWKQAGLDTQAIEVMLTDALKLAGIRKAERMFEQTPAAPQPQGIEQPVQAGMLPPIPPQEGLPPELTGGTPLPPEALMGVPAGGAAPQSDEELMALLQQLQQGRQLQGI